MDDLALDVLSKEECDLLERPFFEEEVVEVLKDFKGDKALGPDCFTMAFLKHCWDVVKRDVMATLRHFFILLRGVSMLLLWL